MTVSAKFMGNFALTLVSIQFGIQPFLTDKYVPKNGITSSIVLIQECIKIVGCALVLLLSGQMSQIACSWTLRSSLQVSLIPAIIYGMQNVLAFYAYLQLDPLIFNLINQSKIIFAAIFLKLILDKTPTLRQIFALSILFVCSLFLAIDAKSNSRKQFDEADRDTTSGLIAVCIASIMSGLAGTLSQKALQAQNEPRNSLLFSIELALYGILFSALRLYAEDWLNIWDGELIATRGFFHQLDYTVLIPVTVSSVGGIGVGLIAKYTSIIHKSYAIICGILLSGVLRWWLYATPMSSTMYIAIPMVMFSLYLNADPSKMKIKKKKQ
eukprot:CAMPEP_0202712804 /NCGR_PEP_ID=MMETSP1385-20130828/45992_1 /ASSEMBLY_ACC=CAM_ASM_000861 /TAXON_ID=933848 /ORGANISM="Elphidium margaritaceum" /LENGTH=324 /DNA_ID=CAMNT_0049372963 /DNA_START=35 /DNA_END=1009 /DNA_ORIENTATION=+